MKIFSFLISLVTLFITNFPAFSDRMFKKIPKELKEGPLDLANKITNQIKDFVDSPVADYLTAVIEGDKDDNLKNWLRKALPKILNALELIKNDKIVLPSDETARAFKLLSYSGYIAKEITNTPVDQAAITSAVYYRGSAA